MSAILFSLVFSLSQDVAFDRVMSNLKSIAAKRARYCSDDFMDPIGLYCNYKRGLPRNRRSASPSRFDLE